MRFANPPENPCFGCGPTHARGLRLTFGRNGDAVVSTHTPGEDEVGWPGLFHAGLHYTVLFETSYWAVLERAGVVHSPVGEQRFAPRRLPPVGRPFAARATAVLGADGAVRTEATSTLDDGRPAATLACAWRPASRAVAERAGLPLPAFLRDVLAP